MQTESAGLNPEPIESLRQYYAKQLMQPEWLTDVPQDLHKDWSDASCVHPCKRVCATVAAACRLLTLTTHEQHGRDVTWLSVHRVKPIPPFVAC